MSIEEFDREHPDLLDEKGHHKLEDTWVIWSHDADNRSWALSAYRKHCEFSTLEEFWDIYNGLPSLNNRDMWFLMRKGIPPLWEDPINQQGGSFKFRVPGEEVDNTWLTLTLHAISENMCMKKSDAQLISGISLSPKNRNFCTISVWNLDSKHTAHAIFPRNIPGINFGEMSRYQAHIDRDCG